MCVQPKSLSNKLSKIQPLPLWNNNQYVYAGAQQITRHALERLHERFNATPFELAHYLYKAKAGVELLATANGERRWQLIYIPDQYIFVCQSERTGAVITVLPVDMYKSHERFVTYDDMKKARENYELIAMLAESVTPETGDVLYAKKANGQGVVWLGVLPAGVNTTERLFWEAAFRLIRSHWLTPADIAELYVETVSGERIDIDISDIKTFSRFEGVWQFGRKKDERSLAA